LVVLGTKLRIFGISNDLSQAKKDKETNNSVSRHNNTQKTIEQHEPHWNGDEIWCSGRV